MSRKAYMLPTMKSKRDGTNRTKIREAHTCALVTERSDRRHDTKRRWSV